MQQQITSQCHSTPQTSCADCRLAAICLPITLHIEDINRLDDIIHITPATNSAPYMPFARGL